MNSWIYFNRAVVLSKETCNYITFNEAKLLELNKSKANSVNNLLLKWKLELLRINKCYKLSFCLKQGFIFYMTKEQLTIYIDLRFFPNLL
jgi:hypothetical protein